MAAMSPARATTPLRRATSPAGAQEALRLALALAGEKAAGLKLFALRTEPVDAPAAAFWWIKARMAVRTVVWSQRLADSTMYHMERSLAAFSPIVTRNRHPLLNHISAGLAWHSKSLHKQLHFYLLIH